MDAFVPRDERLKADGEVVWSRHPDAGVKLAGDDLAGNGGKKAGHQGEHERSRKTIA